MNDGPLRALKQDSPVIAGGAPIREKPLSFSEPDLNDDDIDRVSAVLKSGMLTAGVKAREFEKSFASLVGARYTVAVSTGAAAMHAACYAAGVSRGDEVILSPLAFAGFANAPLYLGAKPVFADVDEHTLNIAPEEIERNITEQTSAIIVTHFAGHPADLDAIHAVARRHNLVVIEDATSALGAVYKGKPVGSISNVTAFSFHPEATITTGGGGMITTDDDDAYRWLRLFVDQGIVRDRSQMVNRNEGSWHYEVQELGYDYQLPELQCVLGTSQLARLDSFLIRRSEIAARYNEAFADLTCVQIPHTSPYCSPAWNLYVLRLKPERLQADRRRIYMALFAEKVCVGVHYLPVYLHPLHGWLGDPNVCTLHDGPPCPKAESLYQRLITLPLFPKMTDDDVNDVIKAVRRVLGYFSR
ncbi:MAG: aminotransferase class I/II-fold pyridoxal phosphate-dependent enzyme [Bacillota bacterium]